MEKFFIISVVLIGTFVSVNTLQCYSCYNCPTSEVKEEHLVTCGASTTTTTAAPVNHTTTTTTTAAPTFLSSTTTTASVDPSSTTTTTATSVDPSSTTTTTATSVDPSSASTTTTKTAAPVNHSTTTSTTTTTADPVDPENPVRNTIESLPPQAIRIKRHEQPNIVELDSGCICNGGQCACDEVEVLRDSQYADATNETYVCAKGTIKVNGTDVIIKSCATPKIAEQEFCDFVIKNENATSCSTCATDKCNDSSALQHSVGVLLLVLTSVAFTK